MKARPAAGGGEGASNVPESRTTREPVYGTRTVRGPGTTLFDGEPLRASPAATRLLPIRRDATLERTGVLTFCRVASTGCLGSHTARTTSGFVNLPIDPRNRGLRVSTVRAPLMRSPTARTGPLRSAESERDGRTRLHAQLRGSPGAPRPAPPLLAADPLSLAHRTVEYGRC